MWKSIAGWVSHQVRVERNKLLNSGGLPFSELLPASYVERVLADEQAEWRECVYSPLVTLWTFLSQTLCPDHSCRQAVARLRAFLTADGQRPCAAETGPYCKARQKLPENVCGRLAREIGAALHQRVSDRGLLNGRSVKLVDGTTVSMPDTPANQAEYPQSRSQQPGLGFPLARVVALLSLASGTVLDLAIGRYAGQNTGETALFRQLWRSLFSGDVVVGDRYFASYWDLALLAMCGVDSVYRQHQLRLSERLRVRRLGPGDWLLRLPKPQRPPWMDPASYLRIPAELLVREVSFRVRVRGWRVRELTLVTTLCDAEAYPLLELAGVYHARWQAEVYQPECPSSAHLYQRAA
jgi:Transposase DDE domain